ncbi:MAG: hypothetical protein HY887_10375 [Deltaproteobacteria bacterium]|nr:hypothetical protein [Deltaproteobacteria bacterium]
MIFNMPLFSWLAQRLKQGGDTTRRFNNEVQHLGERELPMIPIDYDMIVFEEDKIYVAYCHELDISSCGKNVEHARDMLKSAVRLFLEEAEKMGSIEDILKESRYRKDKTGRWMGRGL